MAQEVRDPIHGLVVLEPEEWQVIDTRPFQRLRHVQQLAFTHFVYPGARHTRWEHCVGAAHLAGRLSESIGLDAATTRKVRLAALTHDLGHGPFSHVSEEVFERRTGLRHVHEAISGAMVKNIPAVRDAMGDETSVWVADLLTGSGHATRRSVERDIVSGPADIDKLDYLLRDSHYCGVKYGEYDLDKIIESARSLTQSFSRETYLGFDIEGLYALEEMLLARYHMHRQVYGHRTRVATDRMLVRGMELGIEEGFLPPEIFTPPRDPDLEFLREYIRWDDGQVIRTLTQHRDSRSGEVMTALVDRRLFKRVMEYGYEELVQTYGFPEAGFIAEPDEKSLSDNLNSAEQLIAEALGIAPHWVSLHWTHVSSPISARFSFKVEGSSILIDNRGKRSTFNDVSEVFSDTEMPGLIRVALYARLPGDQSVRDLDPGVRARVKESFDAALRMIGEASARVGEEE